MLGMVCDIHLAGAANPACDYLCPLIPYTMTPFCTLLVRHRRRNTILPESHDVHLLATHVKRFPLSIPASSNQRRTATMQIGCTLLQCHPR